MNTALLRKTTIGALGPEFRALTLSGNEITDASRALATAGDGLLNDSSFGIWPAATNLCTNGGFESNTTGWSVNGAHTVAKSIEQAKFGTASAKVTVSGADLNPIYYAITLTAAAHTMSAWIYIPANWDGGTIKISDFALFAGATGTKTANFNMALTDQWQRASFDITIAAGDLAGFLGFSASSPATNGRTFYVDGVQIETGSVATPYIETNGGTAARNAAEIQIPRMAQYLSPAQGWVATRVRLNYPSTNTDFYHTPFSWFDTVSRRVVLYIDQGNNLGFARDDVNATNVDLGTWASGTFFTLIAAWTPTAIKISADGGAFTITANAIYGAIAADFGTLGYEEYEGGKEWLFGDILWFACGSGTLTNADAAAIHAFGNSDRGLSAFPGNATGFWSAKNGVMELRA